MADAFRHYVGNDGDYNNANNWSATRGGAGGAGVPGADDKVFIEALNHPINTGLSQGSVDLQSFFCSISSGGSIDGLVFACSNQTTSSTPKATIINYGGSVVRISAGTAGIDTLTAIGGPEYRLEAGTVTNMYATTTMARVIDSASIASNLFLLSSRSILEAGAGSIGTVRVHNGNALSFRNVSAFLLYNAQVTMRDTAGVTSQVDVFANSTYMHHSAGTIASIIVHDRGVASASGATRRFTVTDSELYAGGSLFENSPVDITYTNATQIFGLEA